MGRWMIAALCFGLAACGNDNSRDATQGALARGLESAIGDLFSGSRPAEPIAMPKITRDLFANIEGPVLLARLPQANAVASLSQARRNGDLQTYLTADGIALLIRDGVLVGSRGFGDDLMTADVDQMMTALRAGGGQARHRWWYLGPLDEEIIVDRLCHIRSDGRETITIVERQFSAELFVETCPGWPLHIEAKYWISGGRVIKSLQYVSDTVGMIQLEQVQ